MQEQRIKSIIDWDYCPTSLIRQTKSDFSSIVYGLIVNNYSVWNQSDLNMLAHSSSMDEHQVMHDVWLSASNVNQILATVFGLFGNVILLYMIRFISLGEMKVLIPLLNVHSVVGILQTILNAMAYARIFLMKGQFFVVLTGSFQFEQPWQSLFLTSIVWIALFELFLSVINNFYRYLLVVHEFQPTTFFVVLLAFVSLLFSLVIGVVYMAVVSKIGPSNGTTLEAEILGRTLGFESNNSMPFLVGKPIESEFFIFMASTFLLFILSCVIVGFLAYQINKTMIQRRMTHGGIQANALKNNRTMNNFVLVVAAVPFLIYCVPLVASWILTVIKIDAPHLGLLVGLPLCWVPAIKSLAIILVLPQWRRGFHHCWKRWNSPNNAVHSIRSRQATMAEKSEASRNDSKIMY